MSQSLWFREAHELYYLFREAPSNEKGSTYSKYKETLTLAITAGKGVFEHLDECIVKRSGTYRAERKKGSSPEEAFRMACTVATITLSIPSPAMSPGQNKE